jgi:hypothetical protein
MPNTGSQLRDVAHDILARDERCPLVALTDNCDLFGSVHEDGVNLVARNVMRQRPSLFNYGTAQVAANRKFWCRQVKVHPTS